MNDGSPVRCPECDGQPVVEFERAGRHATGAPTTCPECQGSGEASCLWKLTRRCTRVADRLLETQPCCAACWATAALDAAADELARERGLTITCSEAAQ